MTAVAFGRRKAGCLSELDLDEIVSGDLATLPREMVLRSHIRHCATCGKRLEARRAEPGLAPDALAFGPLLSSVSATVRKRVRRRRAIGLAATLGGAALAGMAFWSRHAGPPDDAFADRSKGMLALTVHVKRAATGAAAPLVEQMTGEGQLGVGEEMRFTVAAVRPGFAVILGLDAAPSVTTDVPAPGSLSRAAPVGTTSPVTLPGSVIADGRLGFERIVAVVCPTETSPAELKAKAEAALARAGGHPEKVSTLDTGCPEASVLLRKVAR